MLLKTVKKLQYIILIAIGLIICFVCYITLSPRAFKARENEKKINLVSYGLNYELTLSIMGDPDSSFFAKDKCKALYYVAPFGTKGIYIYFNQWDKIRDIQK